LLGVRVRRKESRWRTSPLGSIERGEGTGRLPRSRKAGGPAQRENPLTQRYPGRAKPVRNVDVGASGINDDSTHAYGEGVTRKRSGNGRSGRRQRPRKLLLAWKWWVDESREKKKNSSVFRLDTAEERGADLEKRGRRPEKCRGNEYRVRKAPGGLDYPKAG